MIRPRNRTPRLAVALCAALAAAVGGCQSRAPHVDRPDVRSPAAGAVDAAQQLVGWLQKDRDAVAQRDFKLLDRSADQWRPLLAATEIEKNVRPLVSADLEGDTLTRMMKTWSALIGPAAGRLDWPAATAVERLALGSSALGPITAVSVPAQNEPGTVVLIECITGDLGWKVLRLDYLSHSEALAHHGKPPASAPAAP